jgi:hypothetical protein
VLLALAHQPAVRVAQIALLVGARRFIGRLRVLALGPALAPLARRHLGLVLRPLRLSARLGLGLEATTRRIQPIAQSFPARNLLGQRLGVVLLATVGRLGTLHQLRDLKLQLIDQLPRPLISHGTVLAGRGLELAAVHADKPHLHKPQLLRQQQNLQETLGKRRQVLAPKGRDRVMGVGGHEAYPDIPVGRALDPPAREDPVGIAVDQQRQHHPRVILRRARAPMVHLEGAHLDALDRLEHEVRQIILRNPVPKIGRKQKRLVPSPEDRAEAETPGPARSRQICSCPDSKPKSPQSPTDC